MTRGLAVATALVVCAAGDAVAHAELARGDEAPRAWHAGLNLRTDLGVHLVRADVGLRTGRVSLTLVVDPKVFVDPRQNDTDLLGEWTSCPGGWAILGGWRVTQLSIDRGRQLHHMLLVGATGGLPPLAGRRVRARFGGELEATVIRHGAGIETGLISFASERHYRDLFSVNLFLRLEYASPL